MKTYHITTFGCQMNYSDSERIKAELDTFLKEVDDISTADLIIINICSIKQQAVDRVFGLIQNNKKTKILITGCILKEDSKKFTKADYILPIKDLKNWKDFLKEKKNNKFSNPRTDKKKISYLKLKPHYRSKYSIEIPISFGCDNFCTYCVVPYTRGPLISRNQKDIVSEAKKAIKQGTKEIWLLGQNVNDYKYNFSKLLKLINDIPGDFWIRYTSPHPACANNEFFKTIAKLPKVTPYIHFPLQSGDDFVLKRMNRPYTVLQYRNKVKQIRKAFKGNVCITTDIIVGFPGETKKEFNNTKRIFKEISFDMAYISQYSKRIGTPAYKLDNIPKAEKKKRAKELMEILDKTAEKNNRKYINENVRVLVSKYKNGYSLGKTDTYKTIKIKTNKYFVGEFINAKVIKSKAYGLLGEQIKNRLIVILGPTASGKTDLSIKLAKKYNGEIISADSRQIYKYLNIGTGKITKKEMQGIKHHMLDILHPKKKYSSIDFKNKAEIIIRDIIKRGKTPILVGGSAFYIYPLTDGWIMPIVKENKILRKELEKKELKELQSQLKKLDPERYETVQKSNKRRIIRAIEIADQLGKVPVIENNPEFDCLYIGIKRNDIRELIHKRLEKRIKDGMLKEGVKVSKIISDERMNALGLEYRWMSKYIKKEINLEEFKEHLESDIWKFQKHQMNWFKKDKRIHWIQNFKTASSITKKHLHL